MWRIIKTPRLIIVVLSLLILAKVIVLGRLVYGDIPLFSVGQSHVNLLYTWGPEQLGTSVRQGLNTIRDQILVLVSLNDGMFYFLKYILPLLLIPISYFYIFRKLSISNRFALIAASLFPLFTPIVFGDFITGQTFWIYLTLPWVLYFAIKIFYLHEFRLRNYLLLGTMLLLSLGALPPIIVPLLAMLGIFVLFGLLFTASGQPLQLLSRFAIAGVVSLSVFAVMAAPYLLVASSGRQAYTPASLLGDYYHNYSGTYYLNIFRLAGNNGNGQSTLGYNTLSLSNALGYLLFILTIAGAVIVGTARKKYRYRPVILGALAAMLTVLGFLDFMATNMDIGAIIFQSQWVVSTIRNPSKIYTILLPLFTLLVAFCLQNSMERVHVTWQKAAMGVAMIFLVVGYGWPALGGDLGLLHNRGNKRSSYKPDPVVTEIAAGAPQHSRTLLMPANHRDELNYQNLNDGLNILRLEGGMPQTSQLVKQLNTSLNNRDAYFFNYLTAAGIKDIFVKKDSAAYENMLFTIFPVQTSPVQTADFVAGSTRRINETNDYWHFAKTDSNNVVFSPSSITALDGAKNIKTAAPFMLPRAAVVEPPTSSFKAQAGMYAIKATLKEGQTIAEGKAQLHDPNLLLADMYAVEHGRARFVMFDVLNPLDHSIAKTYAQPVPPDATSIFLDDTMYAFSKEKQRISLRGGDYTVQSANLEPITITDADPSFELAIPKAGDATANAGSPSNIYAKAAGDAADGRQALLLGSANHTAFVQKDLHLPDVNSDYVVKFQYKNIRGQEPSFSVLQDDENVLAGNGHLDSGQQGKWQTYYSLITPATDFADSNLQLFFYTDGTKNEPSENAFDNIQLYRVKRSDAGSLSLANYPSDYALTNYTYHARPEDNTPNMLKNGSFEDDSLWGPVGDATISSAGKAKIWAGKNIDAHGGKASLQLTSDNHTAFVARAVRHFAAHTVYKLSFFYKHVSGHNPSFAVWQEGVNIARPSQELKPDNIGWNYYETFFVPDASATNLTVYLYSPSTGEKTINLYDDVTLQPTSLVANYLEKTSAAGQQPAAIVASSQRINPTLVKIKARPGKGMVVLNESFHAGWTAYAVAGDKTVTLRDQLKPGAGGKIIPDHVLVNGFANGWWVDSKALGLNNDYTILLAYTPQQTMFVGLAGTGTTASLIGAYLLYDHRKRKREYWGWRWR